MITRVAFITILLVISGRLFAQEVVKRTTGSHDEQMIDLTVDVKAPLDSVWYAWTTKEGLENFFAPQANVDLKPGGLYEIFFEPGKPAGERGADDMHIMAIEPKRFLSFTWNAPGKFPEVRKQRTLVGLRFKELPGGVTQVKLTQTGWGEGKEWQDVFHYFSEAWASVLESLKSTLELSAEKK